MIKIFRTAPPPHLRVPESAFHLTRRSALALAPVFLVLLIREPFEMLRAAGLVMAASILIEAVSGFLQKKKSGFLDASTVLWILLLILLLPPKAGVWMILSATAVTVFLGKEIYGGRAGAWVHPAWLGYGFFVLNSPPLFFPDPSPLAFWNPFTSFWNVPITAALLSGGIFLTFKKNHAWEIPGAYLLILLVPLVLWGAPPLISLPLMLLNAFWVLPDLGTAPCSRRARIYGAAAAALLTLGLTFLGIAAAPVFAVLILNLLTPWLDEWVLPLGVLRTASAENSRIPA